MKKDDSIKSINNAIEILDYINLNEENGISNIAKNLNIPKTTVFRILKTLETNELVKKVDEDNYSIGYKFLSYNPGVKEDKYLIEKAKPFIKEIVKKTGETVNIAIKNANNKSIIIHSKQGDFYTLQSNMSPESELYCSSTGKIFLSTFSDEKLKQYFAENFSKRTVNSIITYEDFLKEKEDIIKRHIAYDNEEYEYGLTCIATPLTINQEVKAAISISGPTTRLKFKGLDFIEEELLKTAKNINNKIK